MIHDIIWDVGGTLFNTYPAMTSAFLSALDAFGVSAQADWVRSLARVSQRHCAHTLAVRYHLDEDQLWARYKEFLRAAPPQEQPPFQGVKEVCQIILDRGGLNLIATHRARDSVEQLLQTYGMEPLFAGCLTVFDGYPRKPDPAMLYALVERHHLFRETTLAIGDRPIDIQAAQTAGLATCLFGDHAVSLLPDIQVQDYCDLLQLFKDQVF